MRIPSKKKIDRAGKYLRNYAVDQLLSGDGEDDNAAKVAEEALRLVEQDWAECESSEDKRRVQASKNAAHAIQRHSSGGDPTSDLDMFRSFVEAVEGGSRKFDVGGKHQTNKQTVDNYWLRAVAVFLWKERPDLREKIVKEARTLLGIRTKKAFAKYVDNHDQRDGDSVKPSQLTIHMPIIKSLYEKYGWTSLEDYF